MFYVETDQLNEINFLFDLSQQGHHLLFDHEDVKMYMQIPMKDYYQLVDTNHEDVEALFEKFLSIPGIENKRDYFQSLHPKNQEVILKTYFSIVDNRMIDKNIKH